MPIQIGAKGATISGVNYPPYAYIDWLSPAQEALATQGGDAFVVPVRGAVSEAWMSDAINALIGFHPTRVYLNAKPMLLGDKPIFLSLT